MNIATRIEQLEKRIEFIHSWCSPITLGGLYGKHKNARGWMRKISDIENQIQALKWVEAERKREMKELGELLKEMGRRNLKRTKHT